MTTPDQTARSWQLYLAGHAAPDATEPGPLAMLLASSLCGIAGVVYYYARFGK